MPELLAALRQAGAVVLLAPTGSGKTTRVAPALLPHVEGQVILVQPRRIAARAAAARIAHEGGWALGEEVGYHVRLDRVAGPRTRLLVVTEGILLRRLQDDPFLEGVGAVLLDEFHERSLQLDLALALLAEIRAEARPELWVGVLSATLDPTPAADFLSAPIVQTTGRSHPVELRYLSRPDDGPVEAGVARLVREALEQTDGDVLAFLPGVREIHRTAERLIGAPAEVLPLHGRLGASEQDAALRLGPRRKVVLATNVAETSLTVPGITAVVDGGLARVLYADPATGLDRLRTERISQASADQRAGRAGRLRPGICFRRWTARAHSTLPERTSPEIARADLAAPILQVLAWGSRPDTFRWFEAPPAPATEAALDLLGRLGAFDEGLTPLGRALSRLSVHPRVGRMLLEAHALGALEPSTWAAILLEERVEPPARSERLDIHGRIEALARTGGFIGRLQRRLAAQVRRVAGPSPPPAKDREAALERALHRGWPDRLGRRRGPGDPRVRLVGGRGAVLRDPGVDGAELITALQVVDQGPEAQIHLAARVDPEVLEPTAHPVVRFDPRSERVVARQELRVEDLVLHHHPIQVDPEAAAEVLLHAARANPERVLPDDPAVEQLLARHALLLRWMPELDLPPLRLDDLLPAAVLGKRSFEALRKADWAALATAHLPWSARQALDQHAPAALEIPSGRRARLTYREGQAPVLAVRMQELFGWAQTPRIAGGRVAVLLHLLAPNGRPQQITDDLAGFWSRTWPEIRRELRARYPRHDWPEDPLAAKPRQAGRRRP